MAISEDLAQVREDVAYIRGRIEDWDSQLGDHENRLRGLEKWPKIGGALMSVFAALFGLSHS